MPYFLFYAHGVQFRKCAAIARELFRRTDKHAIMWVSGESDRRVAEQTGAFDEVVDLLEGFDTASADAGLSDNIDYLASLERELGEVCFQRFVAADRHIDRRRWGNRLNAAFAAHLARAMRADLNRRGLPVAAFGENNVLHYKLANLLVGRHVPYCWQTLVRHWDDRWYLDPGQGSSWPECVELYRQYLEEGIPEPLRTRSEEKLRQLREQQQQPRYTRIAPRGGSGVLSKISGGRMGQVLGNWIEELTHSTSRNNPTAQTAWELNPANKTAHNFLATVRRRFYDEHAAREVPAGIKLASYFLHVQPEHSVEGMAFEFRDQANLLSNIAASLPADMLLAVKEHKPMIGLRPIDYYRRLLKIPNLVLLSDTINPYQVVCRSEVIFTLTGTVGLEAMYEGVPVVSFGDIFYENFEGMYRVRDQARLEEVMRRLSLGELPGASEEAAVASLAAQYAASHAGKLSPPCTMDEMVQPENIKGFVDVIIKSLPRGHAS